MDFFSPLSLDLIYVCMSHQLLQNHVLVSHGKKPQVSWVKVLFLFVHHTGLPRRLMQMALNHTKSKKSIRVTQKMTRHWHVFQMPFGETCCPTRQRRHTDHRPLSHLMRVSCHCSLCYTSPSV